MFSINIKSIKICSLMALAIVNSGFSEKNPEPVAADKPYNIETGFANLVEKALPAVVSIHATQVIEPSQQPFGGNVIIGPNSMYVPGAAKSFPVNPLEELFRDFFSQMERPRRSQAAGTGFIIHCDAEKAFAYAVTNNHVVVNAKKIKVIFDGKEEMNADILATDERNDIAVIKIDTSHLPLEKRKLKVVEWANSDDARTGDWVVAMGNPFNFGGSVTVGVVSHKGRYVPSDMDQDFEYLQHSAQINVGSSGGPLFNIYGRVIGVNNAIITNSGGNIGIGFAIPANVARRTVDQLIKFGKTRRAQLGVHIQNLTEEMAESQGLKDIGVIVGNVVKGGPAEGKLEVGDIILEFNGKKVEKSHVLSSMVGATEIGTEASLKIWRKGKKKTVKILLTEMGSNKDKLDAKTTGSSENGATVKIAGVEVGSLEALSSMVQDNVDNKEIRGVIILSVDPESEASENDAIRRGMIIEEVNGKAINTPKEFKDAIQEAQANGHKNALLFVKRDNFHHFVPLKISGDENDSDKKTLENKENSSIMSGDNQKSENSSNRSMKEKIVDSITSIF